MGRYKGLIIFLQNKFYNFAFQGEENIDFMPTILSRFDLIFIVKDLHNEEQDKVILEI